MTDDEPHMIWSRSGWWNFRKLRARKRKNTGGHVHRPRCGCKRSAYGRCDCGVLGKKFYKPPLSEKWAALEYAFPIPYGNVHVVQLFALAEWRWNRILHRARKWAKKRSRRILKKIGWRDGAMEYK